MGWRLGQGIGTRISLKERKIQDKLAYDATTGTKFSGSTLDIPDDDEEAGKHTYARRDTPVLAVSRKDNSHGLGYAPGMSLNESLGKNAGAGNKGPKLAGKHQAYSPWEIWKLTYSQVVSVSELSMMLTKTIWTSMIMINGIHANAWHMTI